MIKLHTMIYFFILLGLNFSCVQNKSSKNNTSEINITNTEISLDKINDTLKYSSGIRCILQDSKGNYWFGSHQEGVCLFDGENFTYFTIDDGLSDNQIRTIQEDQNGVIWFGTGYGVSSYKEGIIKNNTPKNAFTGYQPTIECNWQLSKNDLWIIEGNKSGVYRFDGQKLSYLAFPVQGDNSSFNVYGTTGFSKGKKGNLWIATYAAVFGYDGKSFEIIDDNFLGFSEESETLHIRSILEDSKGNLWIGNNGIGVLLKSGDSTINFSEQNGLIHANSSGMGDPSPSGTLEHVFVIEEDSSGNIWFGDRDTGAWRYDGKSMVNYTIDNKLQTQMIWNIYEDKNEDLLFVMADGGVYKFNGNTFDRIL